MEAVEVRGPGDGIIISCRDGGCVKAWNCCVVNESPQGEQDGVKGDEGCEVVSFSIWGAGGVDGLDDGEEEIGVQGRGLVVGDDWDEEWG